MINTPDNPSNEPSVDIQEEAEWEGRSTKSDGNFKRQKAVALAYEEGGVTAPTVVATGQGHLAEQILQLAFAHGVKVREDAALVDILSMLDVESPIPVEAFAAVAEILAYVYQANASAAQRGSK